MSKKTADKTKQLEIARRRVEVERLYLGGKTYRDIAEELNVSVGTIAGDMKAVIQSWRNQANDDLDDFKQTQMQRLQRLLAALWVAAESGDLKAVAQVRGILSDMNSLMGLDEVKTINNMLIVQWEDPLDDDDDIGIGADEL